MKDMQSNDQIAVFLDIENFIGFSNELKLPIDLAEILEKLKEEGRIIIRRSFGDLNRSLDGIGQSKQPLNIRRMLRDNLFIHEDMPYKNAVKNSADMRLTVEMLYTAFTIPSITKFAVITGDSDYVPVFQKLQEQNKSVIGISGSEKTTSVIYRNACDHIFYFEDLSLRSVESVEIEITETPDIPEANSGESNVDITRSISDRPDENFLATARLIAEQKFRDEYAALLVRAVKILEQDGGDATFQAIFVQMRQLKSDFDYHRAGFESLQDLVAFAAEQQLVTLEKRGQIIFVAIPESESVSKQTVSTAHYRKAIQEKLRCELPSVEIRKAIGEMTAKQLSFNEEGLLLNDLKQDVVEELSLLDINVEQAEVFKYLYSLYFSRCFISEDIGAGRSNPFITGFTAHPEDWDDRFVVVQTKQLARDGFPLYANKLSSLFYETEEKTSHICRLLEKNDLKFEK